MDAQKHSGLRNALLTEKKALVSGLVTFVVGLVLWLFGSDNHVVLFTPSKVGIVLMVLGGLEALWALFKAARRQSAA
ncbi:DUF5708 family protein [Cryptosporangium aurantiacum]|uniref:Uncharacterized protein n=1 Tax=Cryptosporangium aurantiacum TaxID=134849 RepID=A0A1M7R2V5_9ACTN|nr:DUF5708 family protein [Cryptosporangium aurantiacum]SHN39090.1 hypothetical protein SAMN05443668_106194 [Cryptosporangium aurantiacum]